MSIIEDTCPRRSRCHWSAVLGQPLAVSHEQSIVLTCRTGRRSLRAAQALAAQGFQDVKILEGGLAAWEAAGLLEAVDFALLEDGP